MGIKRYESDSDNTITNAYKTDLTTRATGSNMGQSDVLEVFSILLMNFEKPYRDLGLTNKYGLLLGT